MYRRNFIKNSGSAMAGMGLSGWAMPALFARGSSENEMKKPYRQKADPSVKEKLLLDTDIGSDIDDSLCLALIKLIWNVRPKSGSNF